ncbi:hypothetical protein ABBQ32_004127 [Trebouxia sp. C0010 RCD-2024]
MPQPPSEVVDMALPTSADAIEAFNKRAYKEYEEKTLMTCPHCSRTFNDVAWPKHQKMCTAEKPFRAAGTGLGKESLSTKLVPGKIAGSMHSNLAAAKEVAITASSQAQDPPSMSSLDINKPTPAGMSRAGKKASSAGSALAGGAASMLVCYLCGQGQDGGALPVHIFQCQEDFLKGEEGRPAGEQKALPRPPPQMRQALPTDPPAVAEFNASMAAYYHQVTQGKGTTAGDLSSSLKKSDTPAPKKKAVAVAADGSDADSLMSGTAKPKPALGGAPKMGGGGPKIYTCYMCGQGFSGSSLGIHQPKCQQKWLAEQAAKPAGERRQMPPAPAAASEPLPTDAEGMEAYNGQMSSFFSKLSLDACEFCGRTFKPESLVKHLKGCRGPPKKK